MRTRLEFCDLAYVTTYPSYSTWFTCRLQNDFASVTSTLSLRDNLRELTCRLQSDYASVTSSVLLHELRDFANANTA